MKQSNQTTPLHDRDGVESRNQRVLIIDDDPSVREGYKIFLTGENDDPLAALQQQLEGTGAAAADTLSVTLASQGLEGVELAHQAHSREKPFAVAFIDMRMPPGIDGLETARLLRELDHSIYIVIVTAYTDRSVDEMQEVLQHDVLFMRKPANGDELRQMARNLCNSWERDRELVQSRDFSVQVLNTIAEPVMVVGSDLQIQMGNPALSRLVQCDSPSCSECRLESRSVYAVLPDLLPTEQAPLFTEESLAHAARQLQRCYQFNGTEFWGLMEQAPVGVAMVSDGNLVRCNRIFRAATQWRQEELRGQLLSMLFPEQSLPPAGVVKEMEQQTRSGDKAKVEVAVLQLTIEEEPVELLVMRSRDSMVSDDFIRMTCFGQMFDGEYDPQHSGEEDSRELVLKPLAEDGEEILVKMSSSVLYDAESTPSGLVVVLQDLREQKRLEEVQQYNAFLSGQSDMSAMILHNIGNAVNAAFGQLHKMEQAMETLQTVAEGMERLRQQGVAALQQPEQMGGTLERISQVLESGGEVISELAEQELSSVSHSLAESLGHVREIIHIERGVERDDVLTVNFSLKDYLEDVRLMMEGRLQQASVELEIQVDEDHQLLLPRNPMIQMLVNLVKNAVESVEEQFPDQPQRRSISLHAAVVERDQQHPHSWLELVVRDNGVGLTPDQHGRLFTFGETNKKDGSGIGLHSVGNFVQSQRGKIRCESAGVGQGAAFFLEIPLQSEQ